MEYEKSLMDERGKVGIWIRGWFFASGSGRLLNGGLHICTGICRFAVLESSILVVWESGSSGVGEFGSLVFSESESLRIWESRSLGICESRSPSSLGGLESRRGGLISDFHFPAVNRDALAPALALQFGLALGSRRSWYFSSFRNGLERHVCRIRLENTCL